MDDDDDDHDEGEEKEDGGDDPPEEPRDKPGPSAPPPGATVAVQSLGADCTDAVRSGHRQKLGFNLDAGAAVTAFPLSLAQEYGLSEPANETRYKPANGDELADEGGVNLAAQDAHYKKLAIDGRVTDVQEVLCIFGRTGHLSFRSLSALRANPRETESD